ncbi:MAG: cytidylate kinase [Sphingobacteriales bacterium]|jgi:cytidylate kinase
MNIAIDGFSSCGKSTLARQIALTKKLVYIDSGAMYRCIALYGIQENLVKRDAWIDMEALEHALLDILISFQWINGNQHAFLNGIDVEKEIRTMLVSNVVSLVSQNFSVRTYCVDLQKNWVDKGNVVMDGRDIGTVVMPKADLKIFMTANKEIRSQRRLAELRGKGDFDTTLEEVMENLEKRDYDDLNREVSPLKKASGSLVIDNSTLDMKEQLIIALDALDRKMKSE